MVKLRVPVVPYRGTRSIDDFGAGGFGAPRRKGDDQYGHKGLDFRAEPGDAIVAPLAGRITRRGVAYVGSTLGSVHIEAGDVRCKLLYVDCLHEVGSEVSMGDPLGAAQDVAAYHARPGRTMQNHIHMEVYRCGQLIDPSTVVDLPIDPS